MVINHFGMILQVGSVVSCTFLGFDRTKDANSKTPTRRLFPRYSKMLVYVRNFNNHTDLHIYMHNAYTLTNVHGIDI